MVNRNMDVQECDATKAQ